jgi:predicted nucleic acid-binding protein
MLEAVFGWVPMSDVAWERADEVQQALTERGQYRSAGPVDLLIAATAEHQRLILLTDDEDFEVVASVTGQPVRRSSGRAVVGWRRAAVAGPQGR